MTDQYLLARSSAEAGRLDLQHRTWTRNIGYLIHPALQECVSKSDARVADVATGSAAYLLDLASQLPSTCRLDGFDISDHQFPASVPENVHLSVHNATEMFPENLHGQYDLVHVRLLVTAMESEDWQKVTRNIVQLLKPGGAVQWVEGDFVHVQVVRGNGPVFIPHSLRTMVSLFRKGMLGRLEHGHSTLPSIFEQCGLADVYQDICESDRMPDTRAAMTRIGTQGIFGWAYMVASKGIGEMDIAQLDLMKKQIEEEIEKGAYSRWEIYVTIGTRHKQ